MSEARQSVPPQSENGSNRIADCLQLPVSAAQWYCRKCMLLTWIAIGLILVPTLNLMGWMHIETVNHLGRYLCFAIAAVSLDLLWGYGGMLCLCQFLFFSLGGYAMGMYLAHHGGPEGIIDAMNWGKIPGCLYYLYPGAVGESQSEWTVPIFWKPFWSLWSTILLGLLIPGLVAGVIGFFVFRSRVRGVFFAVLTQAIVVGVGLVFGMNNMYLCGTNGMNRFERIVLGSREKVEIRIDEEQLRERGLTAQAVRDAVDAHRQVVRSAYQDQVRKRREQLTAKGGDPDAVHVAADVITISGNNQRIVLSVDRSVHVSDTRNALEAVQIGGPPATRLGSVADIAIVGYQVTESRVKLALYILTALSLTLVYCLCRLAMNSRFGRVLVAIRDNESRLRFAGYQPYVFKTVVFAASGMIAGLAGMLYTPQARIFTPTYLEPGWSIMVVIWVAMGGRGTLAGPVFGALAVNYGRDFLSSESADAWPVVLGSLFAITTLMFPQGLMGLWRYSTTFRLTFSGPHSQREMTSISGNASTRHRQPVWIFLAVVGAVLGVYTAARLWTYAQPFGDGLMAKGNGADVVVGLVLVFVVACGLLQLPASVGLLLGRPWGTQLIRNTLVCSTSLISSVLIWSMLVNTLQGGLVVWLLAGFRNIIELVSAVPQTVLFGIWSVGMLVFLRRFATTETAGEIESDTPQPTTAETGGTAAAVAKAQNMQRQLERIAAQQLRTSQDNLLDRPLLEIERIQVDFDGFRALDIDSFQIGHYSLNVIIGPNGAGKTTLCDVISGKTPPTSGRVRFIGQDITELRDVDIARMGVGRKFQTPTVFDSLNVYQNMELSLPGRERLHHNLSNRSSADERDKIQSILQRVSLLDEAEKLVRFLSHGQRQWLEISMLILHSPRLLLVDEPAAGLTDEETVLTAELLLELREEHSVLVIEHDMEFVRLLNSHVTVLNEGRIMAEGSMQDIQQNPEVIEAYLGR